MASKPIRMEKIRLNFQKIEKGISIRQIAKDLNVSRTTVKSYLKVGQQNATNCSRFTSKKIYPKAQTLALSAPAVVPYINQNAVFFCFKSLRLL
jgi:IS30 family transposase